MWRWFTAMEISGLHILGSRMPGQDHTNAVSVAERKCRNIAFFALRGDNLHWKEVIRALDYKQKKKINNFLSKFHLPENNIAIYTALIVLSPQFDQVELNYTQWATYFIMKKNVRMPECFITLKFLNYCWRVHFSCGKLSVKLPTHEFLYLAGLLICSLTE